MKKIKERKNYFFFTPLLPKCSFLPFATGLTFGTAFAETAEDYYKQGQAAVTQKDIAKLETLKNKKNARIEEWKK